MEQFPLPGRPATCAAGRGAAWRRPRLRREERTRPLDVAATIVAPAVVRGPTHASVRSCSAPSPRWQRLAAAVPSDGELRGHAALHGRTYLGRAKAAETAGVLADKAIRPACSDVIVNGKARHERAAPPRSTFPRDPWRQPADRDSPSTARAAGRWRHTAPARKCRGHRAREGRDLSGFSVKQGKRTFADQCRDATRWSSSSAPAPGYVPDGARIEVFGRPCERRGAAHLVERGPHLPRPLTAMRVLVASTSGAGHLGPLLPFAEALAERGDEVRRLVGDPPDPAFSGIVRSAVARRAGALANREWFGRICTAAMQPAMEAACDAFQPDLIVREPASSRRRSPRASAGSSA